jgi:predicted exporter
MSKIDGTKSLIDVLKTITITLLLAFFGMVSYLFVNFDKLSIIKMFVVGVGITITIVVLVIILNTLFKKIKELEKL